jgi:outer membrane receptor protein involved in Fe transport
LTIAIASLLALAAAAARAQTVDEDQVIVTATRSEQSLQNFPGSISRVSADDVAMIASTHASESVNRAPGALVQRNNGEEMLTSIRSPVLSGPGSCGSFLFLEDSMPIRPVGFCNVNELFEINTEQAQAIEVLRGPAGVVYGSSAMHGAINVLQAEPSQLPKLRLGLEGGPDDFRRGKVASRIDLGSSELGVEGLVTHDGGWRAQSGLDEQKLNAALVNRDADRTMELHLSVTNLNQQTAGFIQGFEAYKNDAIAHSNPNPEAFRNAYSARLYGEYARSLSDQTHLAIRPYVRNSGMRFLQHFLVGKPLEENGQSSAGVLTSLEYTGANGLQWLNGLDVEVSDSTLKETQNHPSTDGTPAQNVIRPAGKHYDYTVMAKVLGLYTRMELPFANQWRLTSGLRGEDVRYDYDNRMIAGNTNDAGVACPGGCLYSRPADRKDTFDTLTGNAALSYEMNTHNTAYLSAARSYRAPDTSELYRLQRQQRISDLNPERIDSLELGVRGHLGAFSYSAAGFLMRKENFIFRDANGFNLSDGRTRHKGIEYELSWKPFDQLTLAGSGTYAIHTYDFSRRIDQGEVIVSGHDIDTAPRHVNSLRADWAFIPAAVAELEWLHVGSYFVDAINAHSYAGHDLVNLRLAWNVSASWRVSARVNNLTDEKYADRADFAFGNYRYFPGRERTVFADMTWTWR